MNLLNNIFNVDKIEIMEVNKKNIVIVLLIIILIILGLLIQKKYYYINKVTKVGNNVVLVVEKEYLKIIKKTNKIIIDNIESDYSINKEEVLDEIVFLYVDIKKTINIESNNTYKIYLGKESLLEYIIRVVKE